MDAKTTSARRRGRPPKNPEGRLETRELLLRAGVAALTEKGFSATGIDDILGRVGVPKGSFYHYFDSKEAFGTALIERYGAYFSGKLAQHFDNVALSPLARLQAFIDDARAGMARHEYRRGCLIGNLGQEMGALPESYRAQLGGVFADWQARVAECLSAAQGVGEISANADCVRLATYFWIAWEGAVLRAKLERSPLALDIFAEVFFAGLPRR